MNPPRKKSKFNILLADDGSEHARAAITMICDLPLPSKCQITVFRIFASTQASEVTKLEESLVQTCAILRNKGVDTKSELMLGYPAEKSIEYSEQCKPDLIVMGAKGLWATFGILLGRVAQQVVEYACCPVMVVRAPYGGLRRILLVTDGSPSSQQSVNYLDKFPLPAGIKLWIMNVLPPPPIPVIIPDAYHTGLTIMEPLPISEEIAAYRAKEEVEGQALLDQTVKTLKTYGLVANPILKRGDAATEIINYIKEHKIDMVITGSRGLSQFKSWLLGSVSRKLVHYSGCSVLVVRGRQPV